jgi:uncharacterized protein
MNAILESSRASAPVAQVGVGTVRHARHRPTEHAFSYSTWFLMLPMRALRARPCAALRRNARGWVAFHDADHGDGGADALAWVEGVLAAEGVSDADGEIWLQTYPRVLGYAFKPVSFWYCERRDGSLAAVLAEVNNTFGERHVYLLHGRHVRWGATLEADKVFHVSPFCAVRGRYVFRFFWSRRSPSVAAPRIVARIDHVDADGAILSTSVGGTLHEATTASLRAALWRSPAMTAFVTFRIHWQAFRLWIKRVPFFHKPEPPVGLISR